MKKRKLIQLMPDSRPMRINGVDIDGSRKQPKTLTMPVRHVQRPAQSEDCIG